MANINSIDDLPAPDIDNLPAPEIDHLPEPTELPAQPSEPSNTYDFLRSLAEGATFGGADELYGSLAAVGKKATGSEESLADLYRRYQQESQKSFKDIQERSPVLSTVGELSGNLATGFALPLGGLAKGASLGARVAAGAAEGAALSGASSALKSEHNLGTKEHLEDVGKDVLYGGAIGGALGGVAPKIEQGLESLSAKLGSAVEDSPALKMLRESYNYGKQGQKFTGEVATTKIQNDLSDASEEVVDKLLQAREAVGKEMGKEASKEVVATDLLSGIKNTFENVLEQHPLAAKDRDVQNVYANISKHIKMTEAETPVLVDAAGAPISSAKPEIQAITPKVKELQELKKTMASFAYDNKVNPYARDMALSAYKEISDFLEQNTQQYINNSRIFADLAGATTDEIMGKKLMNVSDTQKAIENMSDDLKSTLTRSEKAGAGPTKLGAREEVSDLIKKMKEFATNIESQEGNVPPELMAKFKELGILEPEKLLAPSQEAAKREEILRLIQKENPQGSILSYFTDPIKLPLKALGLMRETGAGTGLQTANVMGRVSRNIGKYTGGISKPVSTAVNKFYAMTDQNLDQMLGSLEASGIGTNLIKPLREAIANKDEFKKRAMMFSLMQTPEVREHIEKTMGGEE